VNTAVTAYARSIDVFGTSGKVDVILPYAWLSGSALLDGRPRTRDISGFGDPRFRLSVNLYGAPALSLEDYLAYEQDLIIGVSLAVTPPLGQYESDRLVNIGTNREPSSTPRTTFSWVARGSRTRCSTSRAT
jgi:hypothetical protein